MVRLPILLCSHHTMTRTDITPTFPHHHQPYKPSTKSTFPTQLFLSSLPYPRPRIPPSALISDPRYQSESTAHPHTSPFPSLPPHSSTVPPYIKLYPVAYISYHGTTTKPSWWTLAYTTRHGEVTRDRSCNRQSGSLGRWEYWSIGRLRWLVSRTR
jgi:hypothetical protein